MYVPGKGAMYTFIFLNICTGTGSPPAAVHS
jgi:hypothetical protein